MSIHLYIGMPGTGKTLLMQDHVREATRKGWGCAIVDRAGEWQVNDTKGKPNIRWRGDPPKIVTIGANEDPRPALTQARHEGGAVCFLHPWEGRDVAEACRDVGNLIYVDDEIDLTAIYKDWDTNPLKDFVHRGRHLPNAEGEICEFHILGAARRVQNLHTDVTSMTDLAFIFRCRGHNTVKRIVSEGWLAADADDSKAEKATLLTLTTQPNFFCFRCDMQGFARYHLTEIG